MESFLEQVSLRVYRPTIRLIICALLGLALTLGLPALSSAGQASFVISQASNPLQLAQRGKDFYEAGQLDRAAKVWQEAADAYEQAGDGEGMTESLINTAIAQQGLGLYPKSCQTLLQAFGVEDLNCQALIEKVEPLEGKLEELTENRQTIQAEVISSLKSLAEQPDSFNKATGLLRLGDFFRQSGYLQVSQDILLLSLDVAEQLRSPQDQGAALLSLGNTARAIGNRKRDRFPPVTTALDVIANRQASAAAAIAPYQQAIEFYERSANQSNSPLTKIQAQLNQLSLLLDIKQFWQPAIEEAIQTANRLEIEDPKFDPKFIEQITEGAKKLRSELNRDLIQRMQALVAQIESGLTNLPLSRAATYARINFASSLIRLQGASPTAVQVLETALKDARTLKNSQAEAQALGFLALVYEKNEQLPEAQKLTEEALQLAPATQSPEIAYPWQRQLGRILKAQGDSQGAIAAYDAAFNTLNALRSDLVATTSVEPIYREFISLLLQSDPSQKDLSKAREVLESLQVAEIDNFFRDPCSEVADELVQIDEVDAQAAVIYPIILSDRLEVILALPGKDLRRYQTPVDRQKIEVTIDQLRRQALTDPGFPEQLRGARGNLQQQQVLQQVLQQSLEKDLLPLAQQMYDWLIGPAEADLAESGIKTLVFVLDGPLRNIPMALLHDGQKYLIEKEYNVALTPGLQLTAPQPLARQPIKVLAAGVTKEFPELDFPPIPNVERELKLIKEIFADSEVLLDREFTKLKLQQQLQDSDFPVVHLATHGQFSSTPEQTFIVSGDEPGNEFINVNELDNLLRVGSLGRASPIELLVLSACNTAQGDNRAILGIAGVAVRAGARSTLATLWGAHDEATAELMGHFYRDLAADIQVSKAKALRDAQLALLNASDSGYQHPYYWAPFVLVGNWF